VRALWVRIAKRPCSLALAADDRSSPLLEDFQRRGKPVRHQAD